MGKTPDYTKKAVDSYRSKFDFVQIRLPKGMKEELKSKGNINEYILNLIKSDIDKNDWKHYTFIKLFKRLKSTRNRGGAA